MEAGCETPKSNDCQILMSPVAIMLKSDVLGIELKSIEAVSMSMLFPRKLTEVSAVKPLTSTNGNIGIKLGGKKNAPTTNGSGRAAYN